MAFQMQYSVLSEEVILPEQARFVLLAKKSANYVALFIWKEALVLDAKAGFRTSSIL
ncbi:hypothetical protein Plhal304r1_c004g0015411 [Plasmopara halstedii]